MQRSSNGKQAYPVAQNAAHQRSVVHVNIPFTHKQEALSAIRVSARFCMAFNGYSKALPLHDAAATTHWCHGNSLVIAVRIVPSPSCPQSTNLLLECGDLALQSPTESIPTLAPLR